MFQTKYLHSWRHYKPYFNPPPPPPSPQNHEKEHQSFCRDSSINKMYSMYVYVHNKYVHMYMYIVMHCMIRFTPSWKGSLENIYVVFPFHSNPRRYDAVQWKRGRICFVLIDAYALAKKVIFFAIHFKYVQQGFL